MAHKKGQGSSRNGRDSNAKRLGLKVGNGQSILAGSIILKQRGTKVHPGSNVKRANDDSLFALKDGKVSGMDPFYGRGNYYGQLEEEDAYAAYGGALDGLYELFGILAFANEIYQFGTDLDSDGRVSASEIVSGWVLQPCRCPSKSEAMTGEVQVM